MTEPLVPEERKGMEARMNSSKVNHRPHVTAADVSDACTALRNAWLISDTLTAVDLARWLPASARAEFIEHGRELESFLRAVRLEIEEGAEL